MNSRLLSKFLVKIFILKVYQVCKLIAPVYELENRRLRFVAQQLMPSHTLSKQFCLRIALAWTDYLINSKHRKIKRWQMTFG